MNPSETIMQPEHATENFAHETRLEQCHSYILRQLQVRKKPTVIHDLPPPGPAVTISHQTGSGAHEIAGRLAKLLSAAEPKGSVAWTVFDRQLVETVLEEHDLPKALARYMPEDRRSIIQDIIEELTGLRPLSWVMVPQIAETVLYLADAGHVILVGRGANFITQRLPNVFHVRLLASLPRRIARVQQLNQLTPAEAARFVKQEDRARGRYLKSHFHESVDDDRLYHLVINTDRIPYPDAARLIADGARRSFSSGGVNRRSPQG